MSPVMSWLLAAAQALPPPAAPPPPVASLPTPPASVAPRSLISWTPGAVRCAEGAAIARPARRPLGQLLWARIASLQPVTLRFAIDTAGRTLGIGHSVPATAWGAGTDLGPALAATQFAPGAPRTGCTITYTPSVASFDRAPIADLMSYSLSPISGALPADGWARIQATGSCDAQPRPAALLRGFPDFRGLPHTPGVKDWSMVAFDLDARGHPRNAQVTHGTGNTALDAAASDAVARSRFTPGARTGCRYPYWMAPATIAAPPSPDLAGFADPAARCPSPYTYATAPRLTYPENYRRRRIEGWAIVRFDVAPWGEIGNATVLAAEPSEDFGTHALQVIRTARFAAAPAGRTGCVEAVRFVIGRDDAPGAAAAAGLAQPISGRPGA